MPRAEAIRHEMSSAVRLLGGDSNPANEQNREAARRTGLSHTVIERLRWKKIKRVPADVADAVRGALERHNEEGLARARHEALILRRERDIMAARLEAIDPDFYGPEIDGLRRASGIARREAD